MSASTPALRPLIRSVALPSEHGGWGFLIEPILLGLFVAASPMGILLALSALGVFLIHQPLKITLKDRLKGRRPLPPRTAWAQRFTVAYALLAFLPFIIILINAPPAFLLPIALALPFAAVQLIYDARNQSRRLIPEVCGALALAVIAPTIAILAAWNHPSAAVLWLILAARVIPSILYIRARLLLEHGKPVSPYPAWIAHILALIILLPLTIAAQPAPAFTLVAFFILLVRALVGLSPWRTPRPAKIIGFTELALGILTVIFVALSYTL